MGQYYIIANLDKKEYITPVDFGEGLKLMEFSYPHNLNLIACALIVLLADGNGRGGGDLHSDNPVIGSWKNNRIVTAGDYAEPNCEFSNTENIYGLTHTDLEWKNISINILTALMDDKSLARDFGKNLSLNYDDAWISDAIVAMAHAHKDMQYNKNHWPNLAIFAENFFEKLYPEKDVSYYKTINGIAKHNGTSLERMNILDKHVSNFSEIIRQTQIKELKIKLDDVEKNYNDLKKEYNKLLK